jgi:hypothetical protein
MGIEALDHPLAVDDEQGVGNRLEELLGRWLFHTARWLAGKLFRTSCFGHSIS